MFGNLLLSMISLSLAFHEPMPNEEMNKVHWHFYDILGTSDHCVSLRNELLIDLHPRNHSTHIDRLRNDLYQKYMQLVSHNLPFDFIEPLLDLYCKVKIEEVRVRNSMKAPAHLKGNFTWNLTDNVAENNDYLKAKFKEQVFEKQFETEKKDRIQKVVEEKGGARKGLIMNRYWPKTLYHLSVFVIVFNMAINIQNVLRVYYPEDDEEEEEEVDIRWELAQIGLLFFTLTCVFVALREFE